MIKRIKIILCVVIPVIFSCNTPKYIDGNYSFETECLGVKMDGSQTLKSWGSGRTKSEAVEQSKKNAVRDVLFKGIRKGKTECSLKPIIVMVNAQENNETYFNSFFANNGTYKEYVTGYSSKSKFHIFKERRGDDEYITCSIIVDVKRSNLREKMIIDSIIK
jgi:hypothetical protein